MDSFFFNITDRCYKITELFKHSDQHVIRADGTKNGYDIPLTRAVSDAISANVVASGGVGTLEHLAEGLTEGKADAVLAASIFHFGTYTIRETKEYLAAQGIPVRL